MLLALLACSEPENVDTGKPGSNDSADTTSESVPNPVDADADGYTDDIDCDDADPGVHPGADETCDGEDDDCDLEIDEDDAVDAPTWYQDTDDDGYGADAFTACIKPANATPTPGDCDDTDPEVHPNAAESCNGHDDDCDGESDEDDAVDVLPWYEDEDGDGYGGPSEVDACTAPAGTTDTSTDCDDGDEAIHPGAEESCNEVDDDCDGDLDEADAIDAPSWYEDHDGDGYGVTEVVACEAPTGAVAEAGDCDDADSAVSPGASERCNEVDDDCDGVVDEDDAIDAPAWYEDLDADGYGGAAVYSCVTVEGRITAGGDCADEDPTINPAATETCDLVDQDCDGVVDDNATDAPTWYTDGDGDGFGRSTVASCEQPVGTSAVGDDCSDTDATRYPGAPEICGDGVTNDCDGGDTSCGPYGSFTLDDTMLRITGEQEDRRLGQGMATGGDVTGDGIPDLVLGAPNDHDTHYGAGTVWVLAGPITTSTDLSTAAWHALGPEYGAYMGFQIVSDQDLDGDGQDDVAAAAYWYDSYAGGVWVFPGPVSGETLTEGTAPDIQGDGEGYFGNELVGLGDWDGDGTDELAIAAYKGDRMATMAGSVFVGDASGTRLRIDGPNFDDRAGSGLAAPDVNADGIKDLVIGAPGANLAYYFEGPVAADTDLSGADDTIGTGSTTGFGNELSWGDADGDGHEDVYVAAYESWTASSHLYLYESTGSGFGSTTASSISDAGDETYLGASMDGRGDIDGDGRDDLILACPYCGTDNAGEAWLYLAPLSGGFTAGAGADGSFETGGTYDYVGELVGAVSDMDGDGTDELVVSSYLADAAEPGAGIVWLFYGGAGI